MKRPVTGATARLHAAFEPVPDGQRVVFGGPTDKTTFNLLNVERVNSMGVVANLFGSAPVTSCIVRQFCGRYKENVSVTVTREGRTVVVLDVESITASGQRQLLETVEAIGMTVEAVDSLDAFASALRSRRSRVGAVASLGMFTNGQRNTQ